MGRYVDVQDILNEGVTTAQYPSDIIEQQIDTWEAQVEQTTGQQFTKQTGKTILVDGYGTDTLLLPLRPLAVTVYPGSGSQPIPDDQIQIDQTAWAVTRSDGIFVAGGGNHKILGDFGWETVPVPLKRAIIRLVIRTLGQLDIVAGDLVDVSGGVVSEKVDRRSVRYLDRYDDADVYMYPDPMAWAVVLQYRRPILGGAL